MANKSITQFFKDLKLPLNNARWSWGAQSEGLILLRTWADEYTPKDKRVVVLSAPADYLERDSYGLDERIRHLRALWFGDAAGYAVIATAKLTNGSIREIKEYRDDKVFVIDRLETRTDGAIVAVLGGMTKVEDLTQRQFRHITAPAEGAFPGDALETGISTVNYQEKLPAIREWLIQVARRRGHVTYKEVMDRFGLIFFVLRTAMSNLGHQSADNGEPILTALIVDKDTLRCSQGLADEFDIQDDRDERDRLYTFWSNVHNTTSEGADQPAEPSEPAVDSLTKRAERFALIEIRTQQSSFRKAVFVACDGRCIVSGCDVPEALEAAHLHGRSWKAGHNNASDGILLRRDLHALYDKGLLSFARDSRVQLMPSIRNHYASLEGVSVAYLQSTIDQELL